MLQKYEYFCQIQKKAYFCKIIYFKQSDNE